MNPPFPPLINLQALFLFLFLLLFLLTTLTLSIDPQFQSCVPKSCKNHHQNITYPFFIQGQQDPYCGYPGFHLSCNNNGRPILTLSNNDYIVRQINYHNQSLLVSNAAACINFSQLIHNLTLPDERFKLGQNTINLIFLFNCNSWIIDEFLQYKVNCSGGGDDTAAVLAMFEDDRNLTYAAGRCGGEVVAAPVEGKRNGIEAMMKRGFMLNWMASNCSVCEKSGGRCGFDLVTYRFQCFCPDRPHAVHCVSGHNRLGLKLGIGIGGLAILIVIIVSGFYVIRRHYKQKYDSSNLVSRYSNHSKSDIDGDSLYFGVSIFPYNELEEATNNFDHKQEVGDGGFGTVYYGKLKDGREVAVKRLYEQNYRRVEQFLNEIEILTRLRHKNLVTLYGCTSRRSRELLLVYEYIPNGTVADHLHGDLAEKGSLTWPNRMNIAIETASALVYLHASEIIHRDVKTNNILLDNNFGVKVADFGLSRLFPTDVTHVSTAPQGTPGYVDPEYYQCYQLTVKSDVYSFGVVLIELISSMPAVDISRQSQEINLSNFAISKIEKRAFTELVDPCLGFETDETVRQMTVLVAELAFQCLQQDKELRPSMDEVLEALRKVESGKWEKENVKEIDGGVSRSTLPPPLPECEEVDMLKTMQPPPSPDSVNTKWVSSTTLSS